MVERVVATEAALALIDFLKAKHGSLMFHQSGGCCDNSAANCYLQGEFFTGPADVLLGKISGFPFYNRESPVRILEAHPTDHRCHRRARWNVFS